MAIFQSARIGSGFRIQIEQCAIATEELSDLLTPLGHDEQDSYIQEVTNIFSGYLIFSIYTLVRSFTHSMVKNMFFNTTPSTILQTLVVTADFDYNILAATRVIYADLLVRDDVYYSRKLLFS